MFKKVILVFGLFLAFVIVGVVYNIIVSPEISFPEPESIFQGPGPDVEMGVEGPTGPPPGFN
ncbi:MAG: hypothetical protein WDZ80_01650 [Candidatus Paceibacterota bacterium]